MRDAAMPMDRRSDSRRDFGPPPATPNHMPRDDNVSQSSPPAASARHSSGSCENGSGLGRGPHRDLDDGNTPDPATCLAVADRFDRQPHPPATTPTTSFHWPRSPRRARAPQARPHHSGSHETSTPTEPGSKTP